MILISIVIPTKAKNNSYLKELLSALKKQTYKNFEIIVISGKNKPADKRDLGVRKAKGEIIAFIDDDAYPDSNWLKNASKYFKNPKIAAVCGPGVTPPTDNLGQQVSGLVWESSLGAGGAGTYRCKPNKKRFVDDYPTFNLFVRKKDFQKTGGFNSQYWPGEDTKLCHDLVYKLGKIIVYDPKVLVYHHRRPVFIKHLKQIAQYGLHRGYFVKILPKTSLRLGYFLPMLFFLYLISIPILYFINYIFPTSYFLLLTSIFSLLITIYLLLLIINSLLVFLRTKKILPSLLLIPAIFTTHFIYGAMFLKGLIVKNLKY